MRVVLFINGVLGARIAEWIHRRGGVEITGLVIHPAARRRVPADLIGTLSLPPDAVVDAAKLQDPRMGEWLRQRSPDLGLSVMFGYILRPAVLDAFPRGCLNLHPALLPYNRGAYPNVWSIVDRTPAGVTLHYMDAGIDTGDIVAQAEVAVRADDTGESLYARLEQAAYDLFVETWPAVLEGRAPRMPQPPGGTVHRVKDVEAIDCLDLDRPTTARHVIDVLRARTFPPHAGAYFLSGGRKIYVRVELTEETNE